MFGYDVFSASICRVLQIIEGDYFFFYIIIIIIIGKNFKAMVVYNWQ